jgi:hypothetical protein
MGIFCKIFTLFLAGTKLNYGRYKMDNKECVMNDEQKKLLKDLAESLLNDDNGINIESYGYLMELVYSILGEQVGDEIETRVDGTDGYLYFK